MQSSKAMWHNFNLNYVVVTSLRPANLLANINNEILLIEIPFINIEKIIKKTIYRLYRDPQAN